MREVITTSILKRFDQKNRFLLFFFLGGGGVGVGWGWGGGEADFFHADKQTFP